MINNKPKIENVPKAVEYKGTDKAYYDITRPTFACNYWVRSYKKFYILDVDKKQYILFGENKIIYESSSINIESLNNLNSLENNTYLICKPFNLYTHDNEKNEFIPYRGKLKISMN